MSGNSARKGLQRGRRSALSSQLSALSSQLSALSSQLSALSSQLSALSSSERRVLVGHSGRPCPTFCVSQDPRAGRRLRRGPCGRSRDA
ncbi:hypothetical protein EBL87_11415 [Cereibacter sphaeroides]|nr:hypothetical protein EBL87_11415 [Cereibacter sphaeroides]AZB67747.1 hypothetical protein EBL86_05065 [Cereibacter sphaeroides]